MTKFVSFDIETATITPDGSNPHDFRPLGICCAATQEFVLHDIDGQVAATLGEIKTWAGPYDNRTEMYDSKMTEIDVRELIDYLVSAAVAGYFPLGWNSLGFDFDILAEEAFDQGYGARCAHLAMTHFDPAFQMLCDKGFMVGMQAVALGLGCKGKLDGMHGDLAPKLWAQSPEDQATVLAYVSQDVQTTTDIMVNSSIKRKIDWTSQKGKPNTWRFGKWVNVEEALRIAKPDTSWMSEPRTRESCYSWIKKYLREEEWKTYLSSLA
jgi:hypothetical protein